MGRISPRTARPTTTSANSSRRVFCDEEKTANPQQGPMLAGRSLRAQGHCAGRAVAAGVGRWREQVAVGHSADCVANGDEAGIGGALCSGGAGLQPCVPDQIRVEVFLRHLKQWVADKQSKARTRCRTSSNLRLPDDHTAGTRPGSPTPKASVADNDLAVGRAGRRDLALAVLGRHGVFHPGRRRAGGRRSRGRAPQHRDRRQQICATRG